MAGFEKAFEGRSLAESTTEIDRRDCQGWWRFTPTEAASIPAGSHHGSPGEGGQFQDVQHVSGSV